jgi:hypothetical protein
MSSDKIADLRELGFADPVKMVTSFPEIAGLAIDNVRRKIADLRKLGFADPIKIITHFPSILGLGIDNIRGRIARGCCPSRSRGSPAARRPISLGQRSQVREGRPAKMVTLNPSILGLAMDNIRGRIADLRELDFNDPVKMVTSRPAILRTRESGFSSVAGSSCVLRKERTPCSGG